MQVVNVRIDERLIHGQVATSWTQYLKPSRIMVIDAEAVRDDVQKMALKMACPQGVKLSVLSPRKASENLQSGKYAGEKVFIVAKSSSTIRQVYEHGFAFDTVTLGNMSARGESRKVGKTVFLNQEDTENLEYLLERGVKLTMQWVPADTATQLHHVL